MRIFYYMLNIYVDCYEPGLLYINKTATFCRNLMDGRWELTMDLPRLGLRILSEVPEVVPPEVVEVMVTLPTVCMWVTLHGVLTIWHLRTCLMSKERFWRRRWSLTGTVAGRGVLVLWHMGLLKKWTVPLNLWMALYVYNHHFFSVFVLSQVQYHFVFLMYLSF